MASNDQCTNHPSASWVGEAIGLFFSHLKVFSYSVVICWSVFISTFRLVQFTVSISFDPHLTDGKVYDLMFGVLNGRV